MFAKLETIRERQILVELINSDDGPKIRIRRDDDITCEITLGPWSNTEDGWAKASSALEKSNMELLATKLDGIIAKMKAES